MKAMKVWQRKGFDQGVLSSARINLERIEARTKAFKLEIDGALGSAGIAFEAGQKRVTPEGNAVVKSVADILMKFSEIGVQIDCHCIGKNLDTNMCNKLSQERADTIKNMLKSS